jgi:hypothetical protein
VLSSPTKISNKKTYYGVKGGQRQNRDRTDDLVATFLSLCNMIFCCDFLREYDFLCGCLFVTIILALADMEVILKATGYDIAADVEDLMTMRMT